MAKILIFDIETKPAMSYHWRMFKENISVDQNIDPGGILCVGYQWLGEQEVYTLAEWELGEEEMLRKTHALIMEADAIVGKNSIRFDLPHLQTWFLKYDLDPLPRLTHIDLEKAARYKFKFLSNKLDFITQFLGIGSKLDHEGFNLWKKVMEGDEQARHTMLEYCAHDVRITTELYERMKGWITDHPAVRAVGRMACPTCGEHKTQSRGKRYTACFEIERYQCTNPTCRRWFDGKRTKVA